MATAAAVPLSKTEQATTLRNEAQGLATELKKLGADLESAQQKLGTAEAKRTKLVEATARGELVKPASVAAIQVEIDAARIGVEAFAPRVASKEARLSTVRATLETLDREIALEAHQAARRARFASLRANGSAARDRAVAHLRALIEVELPTIREACDGLLNEFVGGPYSTAVGPESNAARALIHELEDSFFDGASSDGNNLPRLAIERQLLRSGWTECPDLKPLAVRYLRRPKKG